jgi:hypothetical protein
LTESPGLLKTSLESGAAIKSVPLSSVNESILESDSSISIIFPADEESIAETVTPDFQQKERLSVAPSGAVTIIPTT